MLSQLHHKFLLNHRLQTPARMRRACHQGTSADPEEEDSTGNAKTVVTGTEIKGEIGMSVTTDKTTETEIVASLGNGFPRALAIL
jgi:hypothetical protein